MKFQQTVSQKKCSQGISMDEPTDGLCESYIAPRYEYNNKAQTIIYIPTSGHNMLCQIWMKLK